MVQLITAENRSTYNWQMRSMFEERKKIFIDLYGWNLPVLDGRYEIDQFDAEDPVYFLIADVDGSHLGSLRLLHSDRPHILGSIFPELCEDDVPAGPHIYEITRLCLSRGLRAADRLVVRNQLITAMTEYAVLQGIEALTGIVEIGFLSQVLAMGWRCMPLGLPRKIDGSIGGAFRIDIDAHTIQGLRTTGIYNPTILRTKSAVARIAA